MYSAKVFFAQIEIVFVASVIMVAVVDAFKWIRNGQKFGDCTLNATSFLFCKYFLQSFLYFHLGIEVHIHDGTVLCDKRS
jgi:hypothetical protein